MTWGFFLYEKGSKGKRVLLQDMYIFLKFLKLIFDRICITSAKNFLGYIGLLLSVRSFVRPVVTLFCLSDTLLNFARTRVFISEL